MTATSVPGADRPDEGAHGPADGRRPVLATSEPVVIPMDEGRFSVRAWQIPDADGVTAGEHLSLTALPPAGASSEGPGSDEEAGSAEDAGSAEGPDVVEDAAESEPPLVRLHSECLTGDVFGSYRCDCGPQLHLGLERIAAEGGTLVYLRRHEGRGIGLVNKLRAYQLQDGGADTVEANELLGLPAEARDWGAAATILRELGLERIRLLSNNPVKAEQLRALGIVVAEMVQHEVPARPENHDYLAAKRDRMAHRLLHVDDAAQPPTTHRLTRPIRPRAS